MLYPLNIKTGIKTRAIFLFFRAHLFLGGNANDLPSYWQSLGPGHIHSWRHRKPRTVNRNKLFTLTTFGRTADDPLLIYGYISSPLSGVITLKMFIQWVPLCLQQNISFALNFGGNRKRKMMDLENL